MFLCRHVCGWSQNGFWTFSGPKAYNPLNFLVTNFAKMLEKRELGEILQIERTTLEECAIVLWKSSNKKIRQTLDID